MPIIESSFDELTDPALGLNSLDISRIFESYFKLLRTLQATGDDITFNEQIQYIVNIKNESIVNILEQYFIASPDLYLWFLENLHIQAFKTFLMLKSEKFNDKF